MEYNFADAVKFENSEEDSLTNSELERIVGHSVGRKLGNMYRAASTDTVKNRVRSFALRFADMLPVNINRNLLVESVLANYPRVKRMGTKRAVIALLTYFLETEGFSLPQITAMLRGTTREVTAAPLVFFTRKAPAGVLVDGEPRKYRVVSRRNYAEVRVTVYAGDRELKINGTCFTPAQKGHVMITSHDIARLDTENMTSFALFRAMKMVSKEVGPAGMGERVNQMLRLYSIDRLPVTMMLARKYGCEMELKREYARSFRRTMEKSSGRTARQVAIKALKEASEKVVSRMNALAAALLQEETGNSGFYCPQDIREW
ncbi:MAG: hypothetical protein JRN26_01125 [Nitrososphaerota archaeon]|nr:hypothetical protein [Nitrososphaerota archaeon]MDG6935481.1 hypothetical protein [Nitrososphaerota archaeon]MDG6943614.1 hypothetical protein [Nitrososphaerota archaeon]